MKEVYEATVRVGVKEDKYYIGFMDFLIAAQSRREATKLIKECLNKEYIIKECRVIKFVDNPQNDDIVYLGKHGSYPGKRETLLHWHNLEHFPSDFPMGNSIVIAYLKSGNSLIAKYDGHTEYLNSLDKENDQSISIKKVRYWAYIPTPFDKER